MRPFHSTLFLYCTVLVRAITTASICGCNSVYDRVRASTYSAAAAGSTYKLLRCAGHTLCACVCIFVCLCVDVFVCADVSGVSGVYGGGGCGGGR